MRRKSIPFTETGAVTKVKKRRFGSFANVIMNGIMFTCGISQAGTWPKVGDTITVTGVLLDGRHLTEKWEHVA